MIFFFHLRNMTSKINFVSQLRSLRMNSGSSVAAESSSSSNNLNGNCEDDDSGGGTNANDEPSSSSKSPSSIDPSITLIEICIVGGFDDDRGTSEKLSLALIRELVKSEVNFILGWFFN